MQQRVMLWCLVLLCQQCWAMEIIDNSMFDKEDALEDFEHRYKRQAPANLDPPKDISPLPHQPTPGMPKISNDEMDGFIQEAMAAVEARFTSIEPAIFNSDARQQPNSAAWFVAAGARTKVVAKNISRIALISEETTKIITKSFSLSKDQVTFGLPMADIRETALGALCNLDIDFPCQPRKYRAFNGYCNNVQNPKWGNANTRYLRFLPADYGDGVSVPRQSVAGELLPSAREVSVLLHKDEDNPHLHMTALTAIWGEFILHDVTHTPQMAGYLGQRLKCCGINFDEFHPECFPIRVPEGDPFYSKFDERCIDYTRTSTAPRTGCTLGPREQINQVTSFLDGSVVYGASKEENDDLRTFFGGELKMQRGPGGGRLLPEDNNIVDCRSDGKHRCFRAGDVRANENVGLTIMHTLWAREHNRIASVLSDVNPHWSDEQIFQEARRIVGAEIQHITYSEFLPSILGETIIDKYGLMLQQSGFFTGYDININPGVANSVVTAALRFIISIMPSKLEYWEKKDEKTGEMSLAKSFFAPFDLYHSNKLDALLRGLFKARAQNEDAFISSEMTNSLFRDPDTGIGLDAAAFIIQQGRDHGIAGYTKWREFCHLPAVRSFADLKEIMTPEGIVTLESVYKNVHDIDLFTGGISEIPSKGAMVGPTFGCLLGRQFHYLRRGDRYWYENDLPPSSFSKKQLYEIRKVTLARVICDNSDRISDIQPAVFLEQDPYLNALMECDGDSLKEIDLKKWKTVSPNFVVPEAILQDAVDRAKRDVHETRNLEQTLFESNHAADPQSAVGIAYGFMKPKRQALKIAETAQVLQHATTRFARSVLKESKVVKRQQNKDFERAKIFPPQNFQDLLLAMPNIEVGEVLDIPRVFTCDEQTLPCDHTSRFPTHTGWCNNLNNPDWGKSMRAFARLLRPHYGDGIQSPRTLSVTGSLLPSARGISVSIHNDVSSPHLRYTMMLMQFGQFLDHDITFTPVNKGFGDSILHCRTCDSHLTVHPECFPIPIPQNDPFFPPVDINSGQPRCLPFTRSLPGQLNLGFRDQTNQVTAFIDASAVYGSDLCDSRRLRAFVGGRLNVTRHPVRGKDLLPRRLRDPECRAPSGFCFVAGDVRSSEQPVLAAMHTIWMREHNRIVDYLSQINPHWSDELLYQNGRRIVMAELQHVTYNEFLPRVLGLNAINVFQLNLQREGYWPGYDPTCNPTIVNEFSTAAMRFGHSLLRPLFKRMNSNFGEATPGLNLRDGFFNPDLLVEPGMIDELMRGLYTTSMETLDEFITEEVTNHLFEHKSHPFSGLDLAALNIQRGRDHGLPPYNHVRVLCNLTRAANFDDLAREVPPNVIQRFKRVYAHVDDIDLFTGGLGETPLHGGAVGPTIGCILGIQYRSLRRCDRFWYETGNPMVRFTEAQLAEVRKSSLARIICQNSDTMDAVQRSVFDLPDPFLNPRTACGSLPFVNLDVWKERISCTVGETTIDIGAAQRISPCVMCTCTREGPLCQSLKINNCFQLAQTFNPEDILKDHVCKVQCAFAFRALPQVQIVNEGQLGVAR